MNRYEETRMLVIMHSGDLQEVDGILYLPIYMTIML